MADDEVVAIRSLTNLIWCAHRRAVHDVLKEPASFTEVLAELDATTSCGPHTIDPMRYPMPGAGIAIDTLEGTFCVGVLCEDPEDFTALMDAQRPVPWAIVTPDNHVYVATTNPGMVAAIFAEFAGVRAFGGLGLDAEATYASMAAVRARIDTVLDGAPMLDAADQQL